MPTLVRPPRHHRSLRRLVASTLLLLAAASAAGAQRPTQPAAVTPRSALATLAPGDRALVLRLLAIEDRRAQGSDDVAALTAALHHRSPVVRRVAARAVGRLQRPALADSLAPLTRDTNPEVAAEAVNAVGQSLQGLRSVARSPAATREVLDEAIETIIRAAEATRSAAVLGTAARTLGRLPYPDSGLSIEVSRVMLEMAQRPVPVAGGAARPIGAVYGHAAQGVAHGLHSLARSRRRTGALPPEVVAWLREASRFQPPGVDVEGAARVRRLALLALAAAGDTASDVARRAGRDADEQVRRLAVVVQQGVSDSSVRHGVVAAALRDRSWLVRFEAVRGYRALGNGVPCGPLVDALRDAVAAVRLAAIDALGAGCAERTRAADALLGIVEEGAPGTASRVRGGAGWQPYARALVALARLAPAEAVPALRREVKHPLWQVRLYVARGAAAARDTVTLSSLAYDTNGAVREAALAGLSAVAGHVADRVYVAALASPDYHVVLEAATALKGAPLGDSVVPAALAALDRISAERRETSRDPRVALLERIGEMGSARHVARLQPYVADFDSTVATRAAAILERWTLRRVAPAPVPLAPPPDSLAAVVGGDWRLTVHMAPASGGGSFVVRLLADEAPATVARIVRLARAGYYDGLTFHRVEPAFVIQGGSPSASEYVGDGPFMRDEVGLVSHVRGTLGISTRGRDTGDAQLFVNLTDNFRLDHDYTVFGEIVQGREVAEQLLEADVIERVVVARVR